MKGADLAAEKLPHPEVVRQRREALARIFSGIFPVPGEFVWEVGCGHGHFLTAYARAHPDRICVGIDMASDRIERADRKRNRAALANLHFLQAEAADFLAALPAAQKFSAIYILFPDPWPKRRHHKNRLMTPDFLRQLAERAGEGAHLYFRTDYAPYFTSATKALQSTAWKPSDAPWPFDTPTVFQARASSHQSFTAVRT